MKLLVIGLDGATFRLIDELIKQEKLPTIQSLIKDGVKGNLKSCIPTATYPAWKCYSSGKYPTKLGVYHFFGIRVDKEIQTFPITSKTFRTKEIWDYLSEQGKKVSIINMPTTYPPKNVNGSMVAGHIIMGDEYVYPPDLKDYIESKYNYTPSEDGRETISIDLKTQIERFKDIFNSRFEVAKDQAKNNDLDFLHLTIFYIDSAQHFFWSGYSGVSEPLEELWMFLDKKIGELIEFANPENVILMSDHGFCKLDGVLYLNNYLVKKGYLKKKTDLPALIAYKMGLNSKNLYKFFKMSRTLGLVRRIIPRSFRSRVPDESGEVFSEFVDTRIKWNKSKAIAFNSAIYINKSNTRDYEELREQLVKDLKELAVPNSDDRFFELIVKTEEHYSAGRDMPDILVLPKTGYYIRDSVLGSIWKLPDRDKWSAVHDKNGIFIANGKDFKEDSYRNLTIFEIAPTILHLYNLPIPQEMDGTVVKDIFKEGSEAFNRDIVIETNEKRSMRHTIKNLKKRRGI